jgi:hypothetical protein
MSLRQDGLFRVTGLSMCGQQIVTDGPILQIQNSTSTRTTSVWAVITNSDPGWPVMIIDPDGVNFQNTNIRNDNGTIPEPLTCDDNEGFQASSLFFLFSGLSARTHR